MSNPEPETGRKERGKMAPTTRKQAEKALKARLLKEGYIPVSYRLLQLTAQAVLTGTGNMTEPDIEEMRQLCGYYTRKGKIR